MVVMFALGRSRGTAWDVLFVSAVSLAIAAIPEALPTVTDVILSLGSVELAKRNALVKELPAVETLGFTSAINSDKTGTLTLNQMTAVEVIDPTDRYTITGSGYGLEGRVEHPAGSADTIEDAILPFLIANDAKLVDGEVVGDPTEGALLVLGHKAGVDIDATRERLPRLATLPFDPTYKLMATFHEVTDPSGRPMIRCFVKGAAPAVMDLSATALSNGSTIAWDPDLARRAQHNVERMAGLGQRVMAAAMRDIDPDAFDPEGDLLAHMQRPADDRPGRDGRSAPGRVQGGRRGGPGRPYPGAHDHRRRRHDRCGDRRAAGHPRRGDGSVPTSPPSPRPSGWPASTTSVSWDGSRPSTRSSSSRPSRRRARWWP